MEELTEVENISLLKVDGVTRKAQLQSPNSVRELKGPILAPGRSKVCAICIESLENKNAYSGSCKWSLGWTDSR